MRPLASIAIAALVMIAGNHGARATILVLDDTLVNLPLLDPNGTASDGVINFRSADSLISGGFGPGGFLNLDVFYGLGSGPAVPGVSGATSYIQFTNFVYSPILSGPDGISQVQFSFSPGVIAPFTTFAILVSGNLVDTANARTGPVRSFGDGQSFDRSSTYADSCSRAPTVPTCRDCVSSPNKTAANRAPLRGWRSGAF